MPDLPYCIANTHTHTHKAQGKNDKKKGEAVSQFEAKKRKVIKKSLRRLLAEGPRSLADDQ